MRIFRVEQTPIEGVNYPIVTETEIVITVEQMRQVMRKELMFNADRSALVPYEEPVGVKKMKAREQLHKLEKWFTTYDQQVAQYMRCQRLGEEYDAKHGTIEELDAQAKANATEIKKLRELISSL